MAEINPTDAIPATNASNTTRYFNLPLFIATDKPSWLVDWNGAMNEIDSILQDINTSASGAESDVETVVTQVNQLSGVVSNLESLVNTAVSDVAKMQTTVDSHEERMDSIEADLITQNNLIKSLSDAVTTMQATVGTLNTRVSAMETTVAGYDSRITSAEQASASASAIASEVQTGLTSLTSTVNSISNTVSSHTGQLSSLDSRVTALENGEGDGGLPFISDLLFNIVANITSKTATQQSEAYTATQDCYAYIVLGYGYKQEASSDFSVKASAGTQVNAQYIGNLAICWSYNHHIADDTVGTGLIENEVVSQIFKLKQGDKIYYNLSKTLTDQNDWFNCNIFVSPITQ